MAEEDNKNLNINQDVSKKPLRKVQKQDSDSKKIDEKDMHTKKESKSGMDVEETKPKSTDLQSVLSQLVSNKEITEDEMNSFIQHARNVSLEKIQSWEDKDIDSLVDSWKKEEFVFGRGEVRRILKDRPTQGKMKRESSISMNELDSVSLKKPKLDLTINLIKMGYQYPVAFDTDYVKCNLFVPGLSKYTETIVYNRPFNKNYYDLLNQNTKQISLVTGPPGTGKSTATWLWCCEQSREFKIFWLHLDEFICTLCSFGKGDEFQQLSLHYANRSRVEVTTEIMKIAQMDEADIFVLDGLTTDSKNNLISLTLEWRSKFVKRRALIVSSCQVTFHQQGMDLINTIFVPSWKFQDYESAINNDTFYDSVKHLFLFDLVKSEALSEKYFFAGGSARWMFYCHTETVMKNGKNLIQQVSDLNNLIYGTQRPQSPTAVNQLLAQFSDSDAFIVSQYVSREISKLCDSKFIRSATQHPLAINNPTFAGWIFEADFLLQLRLAVSSPTPFVYSFKENDEEKVKTWKIIRQIEFLDPAEFNQLVIDNSLTWEDGIWFIPRRWNQGCYDAFCLTKGHNVSFIQVTCAKSHRVSQDYLRFALSNLESAFKIKVNSAKIVFVLPREMKDSNFQVSKITGSLGVFEKFFYKIQPEQKMKEFYFEVVSISRS